MNNEDYCSYEISKALKAAGFDEPCDHYYCAFDNETDVRFWSIHPAQSQNGFTNPDGKVIADAPTLAHAQKWLREKKKLHCQVLLNGVRSMYFWQVRELVGNGKYADSTHQYDVYEDAMADCISAALDLITMPAYL